MSSYDGGTRAPRRSDGGLRDIARKPATTWGAPCAGHETRGCCDRGAPLLQLADHLRGTGGPPLPPAPTAPCVIAADVPVRATCQPSSRRDACNAAGSLPLLPSGVPACHCSFAGRLPVVYRRYNHHHQVLGLLLLNSVRISFYVFRVPPLSSETLFLSSETLFLASESLPVEGVPPPDKRDSS